jgi:uncharacterized repeat protein (TIGR01451 family)
VRTATARSTFPPARRWCSPIASTWRTPRRLRSPTASVDWTSLDNAQAGERTGANCGTTTPIVAPNDYCVGPAAATVNTVDTNAIAKSVGVDSWDTGLSAGNDAILRVGDTVNYRVAVTLREGQTRNVVVTDVLPASLFRRRREHQRHYRGLFRRRRFIR